MKYKAKAKAKVEVTIYELVALEQIQEHLDKQINASHMGYFHSKQGWAGKRLDELKCRLQKELL